MSFIIEQPIKGRIYLYSVESYWDKKDKKTKQRRKYLGPKKIEKKVDEGELQSKIFVKNFGNIFLLDFLSQKSGLKKLLQKVFPEDYLDILYLAFYQVCQAEPSYLYHYWVDDNFLEGHKKLYSSDVSDLLARIGSTKNKKIEFCQQWIELQQPVKAIFYDITSISSYSKNIEWVEWGYNRDRENLPQINMGIIYSQNNHTPLWYNVFGGSIVDVTTLKNSIAYMNFFKLEDLIFVLDCGFFSKTNLDDLNNPENKIKFIMPMSHSTKIAKQIVKKFGKQIASPQTAVLFKNQIIHHQQTNVTYDKNNLEVHIFLNQDIRLEIEKQFLTSILELEQKYKDKKINTLKEFNEFKNENIPIKIIDFFKWNKTTLCIEKNIKLIKNQLNKSGCFLLTTNDKDMDASEILNYYRNKDLIEKIWDSVKNEMDTNRLHTHEQANTEGKLFVKFVASILYALIGKTMDEKKLYKCMTIKELLLEMQKIKITNLGKDKKVYSELSKQQKKILDAFDLSYNF